MHGRTISLIPIVHNLLRFVVDIQWDCNSCLTAVLFDKYKSYIQRIFWARTRGITIEKCFISPVVFLIWRSGKNYVIRIPIVCLWRFWINLHIITLYHLSHYFKTFLFMNIFLYLQLFRSLKLETKWILRN